MGFTECWETRAVLSLSDHDLFSSLNVVLPMPSKHKSWDFRYQDPSQFLTEKKNRMFHFQVLDKHNKKVLYIATIKLFN